MITQYFNWTRSQRKNQSGQIMLLFAVFVLFIVVGIMALAIDMGLVYQSKAKVSRTVDAIAIRVVNRYASTHTVADRQRIAESIFEANFGLLRSSNPTTWAWTDNGLDVTTTTGEIIEAYGTVNGEQDYYIKVNTVADTQTGVVVSNVTATAYHRPILIPAFFKLAFSDNPSYANQYEKFAHTESAEAERFPSVNAVIIDLSGSMRNNNGAEGISGNGTTEGAVTQFVEAFDETRDYMIVVGFSNGGKVLWPPKASGTDSATGLPYFIPSRNYITPHSDHDNITIQQVVEQQVAYSGWTNGAEGLRVAALNIQRWLNNEPVLQLASIRKKLKINYVFMTDGDNNTFRTYIRGYGHGIDDNGNNNYSPPDLSIHNTFHMEWPMVVKDQADISGMTYDSENLGNLLNGANIPSGYNKYPENMAGVAANLTGNEKLDDGNQRYVRSRESTGSYEDWTGVLIKETGNDFDGRWATNLKYDSSVRDEDDVPSAESPDDYVLDDDKHYERFRIRSSQFTQIPRSLSKYSESDFMNPGLGHDYYDAAGSADNPTSYSTLSGATQTETISGKTVYYITRGPDNKKYYFLSRDIYQDYKDRFDNVTDDDVNMTNERCQYVPMGEVWANHQGSYLDSNGNGNEWDPTEALTPWIFLADGNSRRMFVSQRVTDFYPTYSFDGPTKELRWSDSSSEQRSPVDDDKDQVQRQFYSWKDGGDWDSATGNIPEKNECDFLMGAQAQILRQRNTDTDPFKWQDATIYTIQYGSGGNSSLLKEMANDVNYISNTNSATQNEGLYYDVNANSNDLVAAFEDIANRIAVKISK
ncbi:MAG: pilus assembly protein TadG-related protein [Verrucomicrobiota bacterium]